MQIFLDTYYVKSLSCSYDLIQVWLIDSKEKKMSDIASLFWTIKNPWSDRDFKLFSSHTKCHPLDLTFIVMYWDRYNEQVSNGSADDWDVNIVWSQGSPSPQLVWQDGRSVCREEPERLRSLFALVFHRWWRGRSVREGGGSLPGNFYLPRTACTADAPSNRTCFRSQVVTLGIFSC